MYDGDNTQMTPPVQPMDAPAAEPTMPAPQAPTEPAPQADAASETPAQA